MKATIKCILINAAQLKKGWVIRIDGLFGIIEETNNKTTSVKFTDDSVQEYTTEELKCCVVKFLAMMRDLRTYPIIHSDFYSIIYAYPTKEDVKRMDSREVTCDGEIHKILNHANKEDCVEIVSMDIATKHNLLSDRLKRLGVIQKYVGKNKYLVKLPTKELTIKRSDFKLLTESGNEREIFRLKA